MEARGRKCSTRACNIINNTIAHTYTLDVHYVRWWCMWPDEQLRKPLDDGGLAHARVPNEQGVVLGAAQQHLQRAREDVAAADQRVEAPLTSLLREVTAIGA